MPGPAPLMESGYVRNGESVVGFEFEVGDGYDVRERKRRRRRRKGKRYL